MADTSQQNRLMLLDTASLYFRAFFGVPTTLTGPDGTPVNAVRGLLDFLSRLIADYRPDQLICCWDDDWRPQWRVDLIPSYKGHRVVVATPGPAPDVEEVPDLLSAQVPVIVEVLAALGICRLGAPQMEADDVIGTLAATAPAGTAVDIVTGDRDLFQLVDDERPIRVLYTARGVGRHERVTDEVVLAKYGVRPDQYADFATLRGDSSDGLPGVRGIGEKTAATLLQRYRTLPGILAALADPASGLAPGPRAKLAAGLDYLAVAPTVVAVRRDLRLAEHDPTLPAAPADPGALAALTERWGLAGSTERLLAVLAGNADPGPDQSRVE